MDGAANPRMAASDIPARPRTSTSRGFRWLARAAGVALVAAGLAGLPAVPASGAPSPSRATGANRIGGADRAAVEAARRFLCPHGGRPMRGGRCRGGGATASAAPDLSVRDWDAGLPAAMRRQSPCPEGTVQARVLFWNDAVRCLPR